MAIKTNSQRVIEARKRREEGLKGSSLNTNTLSNSDKVKKLRQERERNSNIYETINTDSAPLANSTSKVQDQTSVNSNKPSLSKEGVKGWQKYLADETSKAEEAKKKSEDKKWYDFVIESLGNVSDTTFPSANLSQVIDYKRKDTSYMKPTDEWTEEEQNIFGSYYLSNPDKAYEYATNLNNAKNTAKEEAQKQSITDSATSGFLAGAGHTLGSIASAPLGLADYLDDLTSVVAGRPITSDGFVSPFEYSQTVQGGISNKLNEMSGTIDESVHILGGKGLGDVYGVGTSIAQSALSAYALGGAGTMISYFGQGASSGVDDALSRGATDEQALLYGTLVGAGEGISEMIGVDKLFKLGSANTLKDLLKNTLKQAGAEGIEEGISSILSEISDRVVMQDKSVFENAVRTYTTQGMTPEEAKRKAWSDVFNNIAYDALAGAVSGGVHAGVQTPIKTHVENKSTGSAIRENETADDLKNLALEINGDSYQKYIELLDSGNMSDAKLGKFYNEVASDTRNQYNAERDNSVRRSIADMAIELGDSKNSGLIATAVQKHLDGMELTADEKAILKTDVAQGILENEKKGSLKVKPSDVTAFDNALRNVNRTTSIVAPKTDTEKARRQALKKLNQGEKTVDASGNEVTLEGIKTEDGATTLLTSQGEVSVDKMTFSSNDAEIVSYAQNMPAEKASVFVAQYDGKTDVDYYVNSFEHAYALGEAKVDLTEALKSKGALTEAQVLKAYEAGNRGRVIARQQKIDEINKQYSAKTFVKGKYDDSIIDYNSTTSDGSKVNWNSLTPKQQNAITFVKGFAEATGINIQFISSKKNGKHEGEHGHYNPKTNTIAIDVYAGRIDASALNDSIIPTVSHEVTHWMKQKAPAMYQKMESLILETIAEKSKISVNDLIAHEKDRMKQNHPDRKVTDELAIDEIVARGSEDMLANSDTVRKMLAKMSKTEQDSFIAKVKETFSNLIQWVNDLLAQYRSDSAEAKFLREYKDRMKEMSKMWDEALTEAIKTNQSMEQEGVTDSAFAMIESEMQYNLRAVESHKENLANKYEEGADIDLATLEKRYDKIIEIWKKLGGELNSTFLKEWDNMVGKDRSFTIFKAQAGYKYNVEFSSMCKKGVPLFEAIDTIVKKEVMKELNTDTIGKAEKEILYDILKEHNFEIPCAICYVEQARQREGALISAFVDGRVDKDSKGNVTYRKVGWNETLKKIQNEMQKNGVDYQFPSVDRSISTEAYVPADISMDAKTQEAFYTALKKLANEEIKLYNKENGKNMPLIQEITPANINSLFKGRLTGNVAVYKVLLKEPSSRFMVEKDLLYSSATTRNLSMAHREFYSLFNSQGGVAGYKTKQGTVVYWGDILNKSWKPATIRNAGGIRNQSNSDFQMYTLLDQAQMYVDFSAKGYYLQAYTKVLSELKLLGLSNGKINASLIPKVVVYKKADGTVDIEKTRENAGLDENGNPIYDDFEGINHDEAFMLIEDSEYSKSICGVCIGYSDNHIRKLLDDKRVQLIIGFHDKTDDPSKRYAGARYAKNYNGLNEATKMSDGKTVHIGFNQFIKQAEKKFKYNKKTKIFEGTVDHNGRTYSVNDIPKLATDLYLEHCEANGLNPAYQEFSGHENYYKLLADFGLYDSEGNYAPHKKVTYNMPDQVPYLDENGNKAYMPTEDYIKAELQKELKVRDAISEALADKSENGIIPQFVERVNELHSETQYSETQYSDRDDDIDSWLYDFLFGDDQLDDVTSDNDIIDDTLDLFWDEQKETPKKQRAKRRVDEVKKRLDAIGLSFNGTKTLAWTDERIEKYVSGGWYGASRPDYAQAYVAYMTPQQFLNLTVGGNPRTLDVIENESADYGELDFEKLAKTNVPIKLEIDESKGMVVDHEGRHRMLLLGKAGFEKVPVLLFDSKTTYGGKTAKDSLKLKPQTFSGTHFVSQTRGTVVYDLVPLSTGNKDLIIQKFGSGAEADVHYSDRDNVSVYDLMGEKEQLLKQNAELQADVERLKERLKLEKQLTKGNTFDAKKLNAVAKHLLNISKSNYSESALIEGLQDVYSYIVENRQLDWDDLYAKAYDVAKNVLSEQREQKFENDYYKMILNDLRKTKIRLSEQQIAEAKHVFGSDYHKRFFGRITLSEKGIDLDSKWQEWSAMYPEIFDAETSPADQITALYDIYDSVRDSAIVYQKYNDEENIRALATEIYNQYWNVSTIRTTADKYDKEIKKLNYEHRSAMKRMRDNYNESIEKQKLADRIHYGKIVNEIRNRKEAEVQRAKELGKKRVEAVRERADKNALIQRITTNSMTLNKWLVTNSKKAHVPEPLKPIVVNFLNAIDFSSKQMLEYGVPTRKDEKLAKTLSKVHRMMQDSNNALSSEDGGNYFGAFFPDGLVQEVGELVDRVENFLPDTKTGEYVLNQMTVDDLKVLDILVSVLKSSVTNMNNFFTLKHSEGVANLAQTGILYRDKLGTAKEYKDKSLQKWMQKTTEWNNAVPYYAFKRLGEDGRMVYSAFQDGWDKFAFNVNQVIEYANETYTEDEIKEWQKVIKKDIAISGGRKVTMTIPQIMSLYELQKREQGRKHLFGKGMRIADIEDGKNVIRQPKGTGKLTQQDIEIITDNLTARQKEVADKLQAFLQTVSSEWGNEVTMKMYGFRGFGEANYFPIKVDTNNLATEANDNENSIFRLLNMSFTKSINERASNRVVVSDIFDVFAQHTSDMAKYNSLALPVYDAFKWYSYKENTEDNDNTISVKESLETAFGKDGKSYVYTFLQDINGSQNVGRDALGGRFFTNAKIASVGANIKVVALQPTSFVRASALIDTKYLAQALVRKPKFEMAKKYAGIALWKSLGFYDTNIQRGVADLIKHDQTLKDKTVEKSMKWAGKADELTLGYLWNACEAEVRDKQKNLKDEEFYNAVALRLREVIYSTQVVDSTMTRSQMMRSSDGWDKMMTAFMSEPTLSYNMLQDAYMDFKLAERETGSKQKAFKRHGRKMARVFTAYTVTNIVTALLEAGFDAFRDDDDELTAEELLNNFLQNFGANMSILGKIPYVKEIVSLLQGYSSSRMDTQWATYFANATKGVIKLLEGEGNPYTVAKNALRAFSYATGLPLYNVHRDLMATMDTAGILTAEELEEMFNDVFADIFPSLKIK